MVVLDHFGKTKLLQVQRPTALERVQYEVEMDELEDMKKRLELSDAGAGAVRQKAIEDAGTKAHFYREQIAEVEEKFLAASKLGRSRSRYKAKLRELDHKLDRIESDKRAMEDGGTARRILTEEIAAQEEIVGDLRFRVEAEDQLLEAEVAAKADRKERRKAEKIRVVRTQAICRCL